jgi:hypothetical protein
VLIAHGLVVGVPVVVGAAGSGEDLAEEESELLMVDALVWVVGADQGCGSFDGGPLQAGAGHDGDEGVGAKVGEFVCSSSGDERDDVGVVEWRVGDSGVHDADLRGVIGASGDDDAEAVVEGYEIGELCEVDHGVLAFLEGFNAGRVGRIVMLWRWCRVGFGGAGVLRG